MNKIDMINLGLIKIFLQESKAYNHLFIGRISTQHKNAYKVMTEEGEISAEVSGKFRHQIRELSEFPAVGDFVMIDRLNNSQGIGIIHHVLTRKSIFSRKTAGSSHEAQVVATNIGTVFICMSLNNDFNLRRLERYLSIAWDSGATPVIVLTKSDLCKDIEVKLREVDSVAFGVDVLVTSSMSDDGYDAIKTYLKYGKTIAFIGSSGVGKSTLINRLIGQNALDTNEVRNDDKGKHTTTRRQLIRLQDSGVVIDTPGMRELGIISADFSKSFADLDELSMKCRFNDCTHKTEPNCAVQQAIKDGMLSVERLESYRKLKRETKYEGLNSKMIEKTKINDMFSGVGGIKNARKYMKEQNRKKS